MYLLCVYCVPVYLLAVRFHILNENSLMKMNLKRKGIRYNKLFFFFFLKYAIRKSYGTKMKTNKCEQLSKNVFSRQGCLKTTFQ